MASSSSSSSAASNKGENAYLKIKRSKTYMDSTRPVDTFIWFFVKSKVKTVHEPKIQCCRVGMSLVYDMNCVFLSNHSHPVKAMNCLHILSEFMNCPMKDGIVIAWNSLESILNTSAVSDNFLKSRRIILTYFNINQACAICTAKNFKVLASVSMLFQR